MVKTLQPLFIVFILFFFLTGCGPKPNIIGNVENSKIFVSEEGDLITFYALIENTGAIPSKNLYAKFEITHESLVAELGQSSVLFSDDGQIPRSFTISGESGYFISEAFSYEGNIPHEELIGSVDVVVFDDTDEEVTRFSIQQIEKE